MEEPEAAPRPDGPLTLAEALTAWGDPGSVAELARLEDEVYTGPQIWDASSLLSADADKVLRARGLRKELEASLVGKLQAGLLVATGYDSRLPVDAPPITLPPDRWRVLTPNCEASTAAAPGAEIAGILVWSLEGHAAWLKGRLPPAGQDGSSGSEHGGRLRLIVHKDRRAITLDGAEVQLTERQFDLMLVLAEGAASEKGGVPPREIEKRLWPTTTVSPRAAADAVRNLRERLGRVPRVDADTLIQNRTGYGYLLHLEAGQVRILG